MKKNFYAIRKGKNVENLIVNDWEKCKKYVIGCPSIFKGLQTKDEARKYLQSISNEMLNEKILWGEIYRFNRLKEKLQIKCGFNIPNYIVEEIINNDNYDNL